MNEAQIQTIPYRSFKIQTYSWGKGPSVLFVHGWDGAGINVINMIDPLVEAGFRVISIDMPGHGNSSGKNIDITDFIGTILQTQKKFGEFYAIIGHSFGGLVSIVTTLRESISYQKLILISSPSSMDIVFFNFQLMFNLDDKIMKKIWQNTINRTGLPIKTFPSSEDLSHLALPSLIIHDKNDTIIPFKEVKNFKTSLPASSCFYTIGLGHYKILKDRKVINTIINFLEKS